MNCFRKKEILNATKQLLVDHAVIYRINTSLTVQGVMVTCGYIILDDQTEDKLYARVACDNDKHMEIIIDKIAS